MTDNDDVSFAAVLDGTLMERMGITVDSVTAERAEGSMPVAGNTQPYGLLHGGASAVLAETLGSFAAMAHASPGGIAVGIELSISHHRSARDGIVRGVATALHRGRTIATYEIGVTDESGQPVATARLTCSIRQQSAT
ncbi:PaaI family thioesterase [Demequina sp. SO4-18]|uniref:PaaI family thioesterase n=1 Tax=Demequina sp. SO4-18 TaxID=3401026 RepID=UPI003B59E7F1